MSNATRWKNWILEYVIQLAFALLGMVVGFACDMVLDRFYYGAPFRQLALSSIVAAGIAGYWINRFRRRTAAVFVWVAGLVLFLYTAVSLAKMWNAAWDPTPRMWYVWESLFGPGCTSQECVYTVPTDAFLGSIAYSIAAKLALMRLPKKPSEAADRA